jgi:hypothetical protein
MFIALTCDHYEVPLDRSCHDVSSPRYLSEEKCQIFLGVHHFMQNANLLSYWMNINIIDFPISPSLSFPPGSHFESRSDLTFAVMSFLSRSISKGGVEGFYRRSRSFPGILMNIRKYFVLFTFRQVQF